VHQVSYVDFWRAPQRPPEPALAPGLIQIESAGVSRE
jgi:hypothetical protein